MSAVAAAIVGFADLTLGADVAPVLEAHNVLSLHNSLFLLYLGRLPWGKGNLFSQPI
jgi:hypothetical protein